MSEIELLKRAKDSAPGGVHSANRRVEPELVITGAAGSRMFAAGGREYIDYHAAFGPIILGHSYPKVVESVKQAIDSQGLYGVGISPLEVAVAEKIQKHVPSAEQVLLCNTGSEATYHAIRVARAITGRKKIIKFQGCYHGWHDYVLRNMLSAPALIGQRDPGSTGMLEEAIDATLVCTFNNIHDVEQTIKENQGEVAAIILELIPHNIGCVLPKPEFIAGLRQLADLHGIILIFDEVITGFRHDIGGYQKVLGINPDLTTFGKAMANGFPIAAIAGKKAILSEFATMPGGSVFFAGTYNGHAATTAATLATIEVLETEPVHDHIFRLGEKMRQGLRGIIARLGVEATVAGFGSVYVLYFMEGSIENYTDLMRNNGERFVKYRLNLVERGIYEVPVNLKRSHISYSHTDEDIDRTLEVAEASLKAIM